MKARNIYNYFICGLFSTYPVIFLYSINAGQLNFSQVLPPAIVLILIAFLLYFSFTRITRGRIHNLELIIPVACILFLTYGLFFESIAGLKIFGFKIGRNLILLPLYILLIIIIIRLLSRVKPQSFFYKLIIVFLVILTIQPVIKLAAYKTKSARSIDHNTSQPIEKNTISATHSDKPDVIYIILDGYTSAENFANIHHFDNSDFTKKISGMGFTVLKNAHSNYPITFFSLASSLNMKYVHSSTYPVQDKLSIDDVDALIEDNEVSKQFKKLGYEYVLFDSGYETLNSDPNDKDRFITLSNNYNALNLTSADNDFLLLLIRSSCLKGFIEKISFFNNKVYRQRISNVFSELPQVVTEPQPKFILAHIMCPHPPFLFTKSGDEINIPDDGTPWPGNLYLGQVEYLNQKVLKMLEQMVNANGTRQRIIILQGDHGSRVIPKNEKNWKTERFGILNAIYSQDGRLEEHLKNVPDLTPVNTFRILFNTYFGKQLKYLENKSFYSEFREPFVFKKVELK